MNWNGPKAVDRGFLAFLRPADSATISLSRKLSNIRDGAVSTTSSAIGSAEAREGSNTAASQLASSTAAAKRWPQEVIRNCENPPSEFYRFPSDATLLHNQRGAQQTRYYSW